MFGISFLCRAKANLHRGRRLGIWGVDCAHIKAMVPPNLLRKTFYISEKTQKTARILPHSMVMLMLSVGVMRNLIVHADSLWNSGIKTSYVCPQTRNNKGTMVISVMLVLIYHRHYTHGSMKTPDSGHFVNQRRTLRCKSQLVRHCPN